MVPICCDPMDICGAGTRYSSNPQSHRAGQGKEYCGNVFVQSS